MHHFLRHAVYLAVKKSLNYILSIADNEVPSLVCTDDKSVLAAERKPTAIAIWKDLIASDNSGIVSVTCDPQSGAEFTIGQTPVTCEAVDGSGNRAQCSFQVIVKGKCLCSIISQMLISLKSFCIGLEYSYIYNRCCCGVIDVSSKLVTIVQPIYVVSHDNYHEILQASHGKLHYRRCADFLYLTLK